MGHRLTLKLSGASRLSRTHIDLERALPVPTPETLDAACAAALAVLTGDRPTASRPARHAHTAAREAHESDD